MVPHGPARTRQENCRISDAVHDCRVDRDRIGADLRLLRIRHGWRQRDLAVSARCSQAEISRVERGILDGVPIGRLDVIARALGGRLRATVLWHGERLDRLRDEGHAALVERVVGSLVAAGWVAVPETSFAVYGERGSIDILAFHPTAGALLVVEAKTAFGDVQDTIATIDRKERLAPQIARDRGWRPTAVSVLLALVESSTNRPVVARHAAIFAAAFPLRGRSVTGVLSRPSPQPFRALQFLSPIHDVTRRRVQRVNRARNRPSPRVLSHETTARSRPA
jgi:transcriptional regulator with XRE-family HTH domain